MKNYNKNEYNREYNKDTYKTVKVYIREEEYPAIITHMKEQGYTKLSGYIKDLIKKDMGSASGKQISIKDSTGVIIGDNGTINL